MNLIVMVPPPFHQHVGLPDRREDFSIQQFVPSFSIETLMIAILPGTAGLDAHGPHAQLGQPLADRLRRELRPIV